MHKYIELIMPGSALTEINLNTEKPFYESFAFEEKARKVSVKSHETFCLGGGLHGKRKQDDYRK